MIGIFVSKFIVCNNGYKMIKTVIKTIFGIILSLFCSIEAHSENYYVSSTAQGSHDCSSWENACTIVDISNGGAHAALFANGNNFYFDGGSSGMTYNSPVFTTVVDGRNWTAIKFATGAQSPSPAGHDGYVTFDGQGTSTGFINFSNISNFTLDGEKNGAINWKFYNMVTHIADAGSYNYAIGIVDSGSFVTRNVTVKYVWIDTADSGMTFLFQNGIDIHHNKITNIYHETAIDARGLPDAALGTNKIHHNEIENAYDPVAWSAGGRHGACGSATGYGPDGLQGEATHQVLNSQGKP